MEYTVCTDHAALEIGDQVSIQGNSLYVREVRLRLKGSVFLCSCTATTKSGISAAKICHPYISGVTLDGKVLKAQDDTVKVHLSIDLSQEEGKAYPFPYATGYSAEGHTGWYVMPEIGDTVQVVFPTEDENDAYAVQSARQEDTEKTADPKVKYLRTPDGKEIKLDGEEILITAKDGVTYVRINEKTGVDIYTDQEDFEQWESVGGQEHSGGCGLAERFRRLFYKTVNHDMLLYTPGSDGGIGTYCG